MYKYSIIIIIKNTKKYLSKCLDSVVNQTFRDFEIIIVDDCSDESSQDIVKQYQSVTFPLYSTKTSRSEVCFSVPRLRLPYSSTSPNCIGRPCSRTFL